MPGPLKLFWLNNRAVITVISISLLCIFGVLSLAPIAQDLSYHAFVDNRTLLGIANFYNTISNLPFLLVGLTGLYYLLTKKLIINQPVSYIYAVLFASVSLLAFGSAYYHLLPDNSTLLWDRLPMAIAFMSLFSIVIGEFVSTNLARKLFIPFITVGVASVFYWHFSEIAGKGDLRFYILTQFLPMILITLILIFYESAYSKKHFYWLVLAAYVTAKLFEHFDSEIYTFTGFISGHSLKHLAAASSIIFIIYAYKNRQYTENS